MVSNPKLSDANHSHMWRQTAERRHSARTTIGLPETAPAGARMMRTFVMVLRISQLSYTSSERRKWKSRLGPQHVFRSRNLDSLSTAYMMERYGPRARRLMVTGLP